MEHPTSEIGEVIRRLTQGSPKIQEQTLKHYFTPDASFYHPFCSARGNRNAILSIYQWYKILSPRIDLTINSVAFDEKGLLLYVNISQVFRIFIVPFYQAPVTLTTVLQLVHGQDLNDASGSSDDLGPKRYYIESQNDLYQVDQFVRFALPWGIGTTMILLWHWFATLCCILGAHIFAPITWYHQRLSDNKPSRPTTPTSLYHPTERHNASEILAIHGRAKGPTSAEVSINGTDDSEWEASLRRVYADEKSLIEMQQEHQ